MKHFDASSIIHAWDNYPIGQFPSVWAWLAGEFTGGEVSISAVAFEEVEKRSPECADWIRKLGIRRIGQSSDALVAAAAIKVELGIVNDGYHSKGVGENDLLIIATAMIGGAILITDEGRQNNLPAERRRYKIPAVCALSQVSVLTMNFIELVRDSRVVFS